MFREAYHYCIIFTSEKLLLLSLLNNNNHIWYLDLSEMQKTQPNPVFPLQIISGVLEKHFSS